MGYTDLRGEPRALLVALLLAGCSSASAEPLPIEYFTRNDDFGALKISPDGEFLAAIAGSSDLSGLVFIDLAQRKITGGVRARHGDAITDFDWVSDSRVIYSYGEGLRRREYVANTGEILAVDRDGTDDLVLYGYRACGRCIVIGPMPPGSRRPVNASGELLSLLEDDDEHILIIERPYKKLNRHMMSLDRDAHPGVVKLNIHDGSTEWVDEVPLALADVVVDHDERVRFAFGYNATSDMTVIWKLEQGGPWAKFELPGFVEGTVVPRRFSADGSSVLFTGVATGESLESVYQVELSTRSVERLYQHPEVDVNGVVTDLHGKSVIGVRFETDRPGYHWFDPEEPTARVYRMLERAFPGKALEITSVTRDGRLAVVYVHSDVNPGDYYLFDVEKKSAEYLQATRSWIDPARMRPKEPVVVTARDGRELHGYLTRPNEGAGPFPLIVLPHGGPYGIRDRWTFDWEVQLFANRGYGVLQINFRGSGGYGQDFVAAGLGEWGEAMQDDITDATLWAIEQGLTAKDSICIYGTSYGGYAALMGVVREPDLYRCAIGHAGVYDLQLMFETGDLQRWRAGEAWLESVLGRDPDLLRRRSPVYHAQRIRAPVMLVHGKEDWRADFEHAVRMRKALERADKAVEWLDLRGEGHGIFNEETRREVYEEMLSFLDRHLPREIAVEANATNSASE